MLTHKRVAVVGSRKFKNYAQLASELNGILSSGDIIVSGGAVGVDSMAQRWAKENGYVIVIHYPDYNTHGRGATFVRNKDIVEDSEVVLAFYALGHFQEGGTANTADWARKLGRKLVEYEEGTSIQL